MALTLMTTGAAAQGCPTSSDLQSGIRLTQSDPLLSMVYVQTPDGLTEARASSRDTPPAAFDTLYSHPITVASRAVNNGLLTIEYADDVAALNDLATTERWETTVTLSQNGNPFTQGSYTAVLLRTDWVPINECAYDVWVLRDLLMLDNGAAIHTEKTYAFDLGLVVRSVQLDDQNQPTGSIIFDEIAAE